MRLFLLFALVFTTSVFSVGSCASEGVVPAGQATTNVHCLTRAMPWYTNLDQAKDAARKSGRLIFWMHMLGTIDGAT